MASLPLLPAASCAPSSDQAREEAALLLGILRVKTEVRGVEVVNTDISPLAVATARYASSGERAIARIDDFSKLLVGTPLLSDSACPPLPSVPARIAFAWLSQTIVLTVAPSGPKVRWRAAALSHNCTV